MPKASAAEQTANKLRPDMASAPAGQSKSGGDALSKPQQQTDRQKSEQLSALLGSEYPTWWNDHRSNISQLLTDRDKQLASPFSKEELVKVRTTLKLDPETKDADVRKEIAKALGLPADSPDTTMRRKLERPNQLDTGKPGNSDRCPAVIEFPPIDLQQLRRR